MEPYITTSTTTASSWMGRDIAVRRFAEDLVAALPSSLGAKVRPPVADHGGNYHGDRVWLDFDHMRDVHMLMRPDHREGRIICCLLWNGRAQPRDGELPEVSVNPDARPIGHIAMDIYRRAIMAAERGREALREREKLLAHESNLLVAIASRVQEAIASRIGAEIAAKAVHVDLAINQGRVNYSGMDMTFTPQGFFNVNRMQVLSVDHAEAFVEFMFSKIFNPNVIP